MKEKKQRYVLTLKLEAEKYQEDILSKRFEIGRQMYNSVLGQSLKRYKEMTKTKKWRENQQKIYDLCQSQSDKEKAKKLCKPFFDVKKSMMEQFHLSEYHLHSDVKQIQKHFKENIDSFTAQKIASAVWKAYDKLLFGDGEKVHFKKYGIGIDSLEGKSNTTGIRYNKERNELTWNGLIVKVQSKFNQYEECALLDELKYCRITRKFVRGKYKYYLQLILVGVPPQKITNDGVIKSTIGTGNCGIDIGTQTIAIVSDTDCKLYELAPRVQNIEGKKRIIQRKMDRSKRAANPGNYNQDGTIKKGIKLHWTYSNKYKKLSNELKELYRKQADIRKLCHNTLANEIVEQCSVVKVENMNYKALQKRAKKTTVNEKGKINKKKRFGKSLANKAPSMFLNILRYKIEKQGGEFIEVNTFKVKASQYSHITQECTKKKLSQRWNYLNEQKIQRDLYSAFLIKNVDGYDVINNEQCVAQYDNFVKMHDEEINRLKDFKNVSSIGV